MSVSSGLVARRPQCATIIAFHMHCTPGLRRSPVHVDRCAVRSERHRRYWQRRGWRLLFEPVNIHTIHIDITGGRAQFGWSGRQCKHNGRLCSVMLINANRHGGTESFCSAHANIWLLVTETRVAGSLSWYEESNRCLSLAQHCLSSFDDISKGLSQWCSISIYCKNIRERPTQTIPLVLALHQDNT